MRALTPYTLMDLKRFAIVLTYIVVLLKSLLIVM